MTRSTRAGHSMLGYKLFLILGGSACVTQQQQQQEQEQGNKGNTYLRSQKKTNAVLV